MSLPNACGQPENCSIPTSHWCPEVETSECRLLGVTCACDLRELLRVPLRSQGYCAVWRGQSVKNPPAMQETPVRFLGWEDPLEKGKASHSSLVPPGLAGTIHSASLLFESPGKPKNTAVGSLSLLQGIFPTQESNWGLLHCRRILHQLSYP